MELLHSFNMVQYVKAKIRIGHVIDLMITNEGHNILYNLHMSCMFSDYFVVKADLQIFCPPRQNKTVSLRKYDTINMTDFSDEFL